MLINLAQGPHWCGDSDQAAATARIVLAKTPDVPLPYNQAAIGRALQETPKGKVSLARCQLTCSGKRLDEKRSRCHGPRCS